ncbi:hypothetical protein GCM10014713_33050 [Streptomyces purpureus]|uniref:Uncharacterized protein n=1 Tax=Streptomyces purpureus TaxID=1951 RepID=A0A918H444_9ACTN|nr:hypothetical protein GCM10014713_33050 [Streptomyces purpureus]
MTLQPKPAATSKPEPPERQVPAAWTDPSNPILAQLVYLQDTRASRVWTRRSAS